MHQPTLFVQIQGRTPLVEVAVAKDVTARELHQALSAAGVTGEEGFFVFIDEADQPITADGQDPVAGLKHGTRVHVAACKQIQVAVHYAGKTVERSFGPGVRVANVKKWAIRELALDRVDAADYVLMLCDSQTQPSTDTPLHALAGERSCAICFNLVPEKKVEG